jgi:hypothetical protein
MSTPRHVFALLGFLGFLLACSGATSLVEGGARKLIADEAGKALAEAMEVPRSAVSVEAVGDRFVVKTPKWGGDCALGPDAGSPPGFPLAVDKRLVWIDCIVAPDCEEAFGFDCKGAGDLHMVFASDETGPAERRANRTAEMEGRGWHVESSQQENGTLLKATEGDHLRAVALVSNLEGGGFELLVAPE